MNDSNTKLTNDIAKELEVVLKPYPTQAIYILTDSNSKVCCLPLLLSIDKLKNSHIITIPAGDENKNIDSLLSIWKHLSENGATRKSILLNVGGGMVTDIGGFAAASFKRGMDYINISTTLLGAVDAATGGKTGINFLGLKNEIGAFAPAKSVLIDVEFFKTLDNQNIRSGYAEMLKHALIYSAKEWQETTLFDLDNIDYEALRVLLKRNIDIKEEIVEKDPKEMGIRRALNFGHTIGHAIETYSYQSGKPLLHGYAIAYGMIAEAYLSFIKMGLPKEHYFEIKNFIDATYGKYDNKPQNYDALLKLMTHDKKNDGDEINFTLLKEIGVVAINQTATMEEIKEALSEI